MRQVVLDTETTGLEVAQGHRIIEIGCVEIIHRRVTDQQYHQFLNPDRSIDEGAFRVHGISQSFLADKPGFSDIADDLIQFIDDAELIVHNASFDVAFINAELSLVGHTIADVQDCCKVVDSLELARKIHPGLNNSLNDLCRRYAVDNSRRELHGALVDAQLLAEVYLAMTSGQTALSLVSGMEKTLQQRQAAQNSAMQRLKLKIIYANEDELRAHDAFLHKIQRQCDQDRMP